jgi:hypothetical protein
MSFLIENVRLRELIAIVKENEEFFSDFVLFLEQEGYENIHAFINESSDEKATEVISKYLRRVNEVKLYDGLLRPYPNPQARWYFLAWLFRDAPAQRLKPLVAQVPGRNLIEKEAFLLNEIRKFVAPLFPNSDSWSWAAISEVMLARLEGSRRALKGTLFEEIIRRNLMGIFEVAGLALQVSAREVRIHQETYDVQVIGPRGSILLPVKTRETMGGGHAILFTRDIYKSISVAEENGFTCVPIIIAESWGGDLEALTCEHYIYIQFNPNQIAEIEPILAQKLRELLPLFEGIA